MNKFQPGGLRNRRDDIGGRPRGDINSYAPKSRQGGGKPGFKKSFGDRGSKPFGRNERDREARPPMKSYDAICTSCGAKCDVPFRPDGTKPVLCRDCFSKKNASATNMAGHPERFTRTERQGHSRDTSYGEKHAPAGVSKEQYDLLVAQLTTLEAKVSQILELVLASEKLVTNLPELTVEAPAVAKKKTAAKKAPAKKAAPKKVAVKKVTKKATKKTK